MPKDKNKEGENTEVAVAVAEAKPLSIEASIEEGVIHSRVYPQIRVGVCEFHGTPYGVVDKNTLKGKCMHICKNDPLCPHSKTGCPWEEGYTGKEQPRPVWDIIDGEQVQVGIEKYCRHEHNYKGLTMRCTYCPKDANMRGTVFGRTLYVFGSPDDDSKLIVCCSDYRCITKHQQRFTRRVV